MADINKVKQKKSTAVFSVASAISLISLLQSKSQAQTEPDFELVANINYEIINNNIVIQTPEGPLIFGSSQYFIESGKVFLSEISVASVELAFASTSITVAPASATTFVATSGISGTAMLGGLALIGGAAALASSGGSDTSTPAPNSAPTLANSLPDTNTSVGTSFSFEIPANTFIDSDNDTLSYSATLANRDALPTWLEIDQDNGTVSGTPPIDSEGNYDITITTTDNRGGEVSDTFALEVTLPDPAITNTESTIHFAETLAASTEFVITSNDIHSWSLEGPDAGLFTIDSNGVIRFNATAAELVDYENQSDSDGDGTYNVTVKGISFLGEEVTKDFSLVVTDVSELPDFITSTEYGGTNAGVQSLVSLDGNSSYSHWEGNGKTNTATELTYSFQNQGATIGLGPFFGNSSVTLDENFNAAGQEFITQVFDNFSSVANITFTEITSQASVNNGGADIRIAQGSSELFGLDSSILGFVTGQPDENNPKVVDSNGNLFLISDSLTDSSFSDSTPYSDERNTVAHELGHALGLDHPFNSTGSSIAGFYPYDSTSHTDTNSLGVETGGAHNSPLTDDMLETIMTYYNGYNPGTADKSSPWKLGIYDIAALQHLYGANYETNAGDTTYTYNENIPVFDVIWDGGGTDTIVHHGSNSAFINLNEGETSHLGSTPNWSLSFSSEELGHDAGSIITNATLSDVTNGTVTISANGSQVTFTSNLELGGTASSFDLTTETSTGASTVFTFDLSDLGGYVNDHSSSNVGIAFGVTIENGTGGSGDDIIIGNAANNILIGNEGDDELHGRGGNDLLTGGTGDDYFIFDNATISVASNEFGNNTISDFTSGQDTIHIQSEVGADNVSFSEDVLTLGTAGTITLTGITSLIEGTDYIFV
jgi:hypothetical protein